MRYLLHLVARPLGVLVGLFCVLTAMLLYPTDEGNIQSRLEDFWVRIDDYQHLALSRHAAFMTNVAKLETRLLDRVFGARLVSIQALEVSFCFSMLGVFLSLWPPSAPLLLTYRIDTLVASDLLVFCLVILGVAFMLQYTVIRIVIFGVSVVFSVLLLAIDRDFSIDMSIALGVALACDVAFVTLTRRLLRWAGHMTSSYSVFMTVLCLLLLAASLVSPLYLFNYPDKLDVFRDYLDVDTIWISCGVVAGSNIVDVCLALVFVILAAILLIHRALWPLLTRVVFRVQGVGTKGRRAILSAVGVSLLGSSVFGGKLLQLLVEVVKVAASG